MDFEKPEDFYRVYDRLKDYATPELRPKHIRWFDRECWAPAACRPGHAMLEIGCGTGQFLLYLRHKGVERLSGLDSDRRLGEVLPAPIADAVRITDLWDFLDDPVDPGAPFDRVFALDVIEHFTPADGVRLLTRLKPLLAPAARVTLRTPNMASPWGAQHQFSDLTHLAAYTPGSMEQLALAAGYGVVAFAEQRRGSPFRRFAEDRLHGFLGAVLTQKPRLWSANFITVLAPDGS